MQSAAEPIRRALAAGRNLLEHEALQLLQGYGIPVPPFRLLPHGEPLPAGSLAGLEYPVVAKAVSPQIVHKSEVGAVRLKIPGEEALRQALAEMEQSIAARAPGATIEAWLACPYLGEGTEIIAGTTVDPQFGPAVMVGVGGVLTEAYRDVVFRLVPLSQADAEEMIEEIKAQAVLDGTRGRPPVSRAGLAQLLVRLGRMVEENPAIRECDLNPIICRGESLVVADARVRLAG